SRTESISIQNDAKDLETVRKFFNIDRFVPIGYSYLGLMVAMYAREHPERIEKMIQMSPLAMTPAERGYANDTGGAPKDLLDKDSAMMKSGAIDTQPREFCEVDQRYSRITLSAIHYAQIAFRFICELENEWPKNVQHTFKLLMSGAPISLTAA